MGSGLAFCFYLGQRGWSCFLSCVCVSRGKKQDLTPKTMHRRLKEMQNCKGGTLGNVPLKEGADSLINQDQDISGIEAQLEYSIQTEEEDQE